MNRVVLQRPSEARSQRKDGPGTCDRSLSTASADDPAAAARLDSLGQALPLEGRPLGFYITRRIRDSLGERALAEVVGDPIGWLEAYQRAARSPACPRLSDAAVGCRVHEVTGKSGGG
ncbi:MAG: DUF5700 domain-containing putative Zn-dependent protease [Gemmatimonadota bacterium]